MKWVTPAPVRSVRDDQFEILAKEFIENLEQHWMLKKAKKNTEAATWNDRVQSSINEADVYKTKGDKHVYFVDGKAAALMVTSEELTEELNAIKIKDLSAHPGAAGAGEIMIEYAVNLSDNGGKQGRISLFAAGNSGGFYEKLGFTTHNSLNFKLDPGKSELWCKLSDGLWHLKKYTTEEQFFVDSFE
jgi:hypothetical protein